MKKSVLSGLIALAAVAPVLVKSYLDLVGTKVKVYAMPEQVARIAPDVLEFYDGGDGWFVGAVTQCYCFLGEEHPMAAWSRYHSDAEAAKWRWSRGPRS